MKININDYQYSPTNSVGNTLKKPLFNLVSNIAISISTQTKPWESPIPRIAKIALHCLIAVILIIPAGMAYLLGKTISCFGRTKINSQTLSLSPPEMKIPEDLAAKNIDIALLSEKYNSLALAGFTDTQRDSLERLCRWTKQENNSAYPNNEFKRTLFYSQLSIFLKGIVEKLSSGEISKDKEKDILMELAEASTRCYPTWIETAHKLYAEINGQEEDAKVKLLRLIQDYKESILIEFVQSEVDTQWHALNFVRNIVGNDLGLNTHLNEFDPYASNQDAAFGKSLTKWLFLQKYEDTNRLIASLHTKINAESYDGSYYDFLVKLVSEKGIENPSDYVANHFYNEDYQLKSEAINFMLKSIDILN